VTATDATGAQVSDQVTVGPPTKPAESKRKRWLAFGAAAAAVIAFGLAAIFLLGGSPEPSAGAVVGKPIAIGNKSYWLTTGEGAAWVTNGGGEAITRVDPVTGRTTSIDIGKYSSPTVLAAGQGAVWVFADPYDHYLSRVDPKTNKVTNIRVPEYTPRAQLALGQGAVWILDIDHRRVVGVDAETNRVTRPIPVDPKPTAITVGGGWIYVAHRSGKYETIDPDLKQTFGSGRLTSDRLSGMEYADGKLYGFQGTHQVAVADPDSGARGRPIELGRGVNAFVVGLGAIWALDAFDGKLVRIDPATRQPVGEPIPVGDGPLTLTVGEGFVWVTLTDGKLVRVRPS
jgi:streptogramin lyase